MKEKTFDEINEIFDFEIDRIVRTIKKEKAKKVLLQFPEGMKPNSLVLSDEIQKRTKSECFISLDSCFGACDLPIDVKNLGIDLIIQFGHSDWSYGKDITVL